MTQSDTQFALCDNNGSKFMVATEFKSTHLLLQSHGITL